MIRRTGKLKNDIKLWTYGPCKLLKAFCIDKRSAKIIPCVNIVVRWQVRAQEDTVHLVIPDCPFTDPQISAPKFVRFIYLYSRAVSRHLSAYHLDLSAHADNGRKIPHGGGKLTTYFWAQDSSSRLDTSCTSGDAKISPLKMPFVVDQM